MESILAVERKLSLVEILESAEPTNLLPSPSEVEEENADSESDQATPPQAVIAPTYLASSFLAMRFRMRFSFRFTRAKSAGAGTGGFTLDTGTCRK